METKLLLAALCGFTTAAFAATPDDGSVLPFPMTPSASKAAPRLQDSIHKRRVEPEWLPRDAPNILIVLIDDAGFGTPDTFGGFAHTPMLTKLREAGIAYNRFHTTAISSPTRASLLTGRNHQRVGSGTIAERAVDWDGYTGVMPKTAATVAEVLRHYGYKTSCFGKWHNTPADQTTAMGPFEYWPTGYGFDYFYGFLAGETSQWEPRLVENTTPIEPPHGKHLTELMTDQSIVWLKKHRALSPDKPFFMYWASGAVHGPHHVAKEWANKYKGRFDQGWDRLREEIFARQKAMGWIPADTKLTPRHPTMAAWDSIPESERAFQSRLMELYAGFIEHTDAEIGRLITAMEELGVRDNTLIFYIWGDNGSSSEGLYGTISEHLAQNGIPTKISQHIEALNEFGGLDALGGPKTDNMYHAGWAWAGSTPYQGTKLMGAYFGGIRQPMAVSWPKRIKADATARPQFHHVIDIVPTIYELTKITAPRVVNGFKQDPIAGVSMVYSLGDAKAAGTRKTQFFDIMASRGIYHEGWFASAPGPREPWVGGIPKGIKEWSPLTDKWELYHIDQDWSQAKDLAAANPKKLEQMKALFIEESKKNKNLPIGGGLWSTAMFHPEDAPASPLTEWTFDFPITRMPESAAPKLGKNSSLVSMDVDVPANANGVLYALAGFSGGITTYVKDGFLNYEFNLFEVQRTKIRSKERLAPGKAKVEVESKLVDKIGGPMDVTLKVNGQVVGQGRVPAAMSLHFTSNATFDIGTDLDSPVSLDYYDQAPFAFNGTIGRTQIMYLKK